MLRELCALAGRLRSEQKLPPTCHKQKAPDWVVDLGASEEKPQIIDFRKAAAKDMYRPDRQRSGTPAPHNLKPYLLFDDARYVFGLAEPGRKKAAALVHAAFVELVTNAATALGDHDIGRVAELVRDPPADILHRRIAPRDWITFRVGQEYLVDRPAVRGFWIEHLAKQLEIDDQTTCLVCGQVKKPVLTLPREVVILGQKCQVSSFNLRAFKSFGKDQTANAPICFECASDAIDALEYLRQQETHSAVLCRDGAGAKSKRKRKKENPLRNQLAVFWLKRAPTHNMAPFVFDERLLGSIFRPETGDRSQPSPELSQLRAALRTPWTGGRSALVLAEDAFYLAVLTANKGRLIVRDWIFVSLADLLSRLARFVDATRIIGPWGEEPREFPIPTLIEALASNDPNLTRALLHVALRGDPVPEGVLQQAIRRFGLPKTLRNSPDLLPLAATLKLWTVFNEGEPSAMTELDHDRKTRAYLSGQLLAILEEIQQRAAGWKLTSTLVDRFYGAASAAPAAYLSILLNRAQTGHLPKVRREGRGHAAMERLIEDVMAAIEPAQGLPETLSLTEQADFALGFYHQRAAFRREKAKKRAEVETRQPTTGGEV